jgi:hypothetical protein
MKCSRRSSVRAFGLLTSALIGAVILSGTPNDAAARRPAPAVSPTHAPAVSLSLETEYGAALASYSLGGSMYVAGALGQRYNIRVSNNSSERVEVVVTVDGRDVVSGELGNYKKQRGYVIGPFDSVVIDGYRRSLSHVAAFRFSDIGTSYSARRGTPQHVGVVGVAVFKEKRARQRRSPKPISPRPYYEPYTGGRDDSSTRAKRSAAPPAPSSAPRGGALAEQDASPGDAGGFAPAPRTNNIGTEFGETRFSAVHEVEFKRRRSKRPDARITLYYDTRDGLRARGVAVDPPYPYPYPYGLPEPEPFPSTRGFTPPPPPRR